MSTRVLERVEGWRTRRFDSGYRGLQRLAADEFSGVVRAGDTELFMTSGVPVALRGGDIEVFEETAGTAYSAPSPALPLLAVMQEQNDELRDQFYTEQTPLSTVDETLSEGGFTGYVELSEDVLSGDYYLVYHAGTSMAVGFVGQSSRLVGGREAFETAVDEVGIYQVRPVTLEPVGLPEPTPEPESEPEPTGPDSGVETADERVTESAGGAETNSGERATDPAVGGTTAGLSGDEHGSVAEQPESGAGHTAGTEPVGNGQTGTPDAPDTELRTIPSIDPDRTTGRADEQPATDQATQPDELGDGPSADGSRATAEPELVESSDGSSADESEPATRPAPVEPGTDNDRTSPDSTTGERLDPHSREQEDDNEPGEQLTRVREERDELEAQLTAVSEERDTLRERLDATREERDALRRQLDTLDRGGNEPDPVAAESTRELTGSEAVEETAVFVRYSSQGGVTLSDIQTGDGDRASLRANLQLEVYGGFDGPVSVEGQPYETFVASTIPYEFVEWVLTTLPFEITETGNRKSLSRMHDALPSIDRADLDTSVETADGTESFDVVFRDQRGRPLFVATVDSDRDPVREAEMEQLVTAAKRTGNSTDSLAGVFLVTPSYFESEALDIAEEATQGRLDSQSSQKSLVNLSRDRGYHLCLVEAREGSPYLTVPEL
ncbi:MAG: hypothetical protein J07HX64_02398 [halophilic archaeon J07HX64]|jgi:hypothetical protein|nr:MAG: hypothetical protein J07HX64_02398 [halophilic archaeon J07HX64]